MNKTAFLKALKKQLKSLNPPEIQKHIDYYDEIVSDMMENGLTEEEALAKIGSPQQLGREILENTAPEGFRKKDVPGRMLTAASAAAVLLTIADAVRIHIMFPTAVSIIGGADGPTSIFVAGKIGRIPGLYEITAVLVLATAVYFLLKNRTSHK